MILIIIGTFFSGFVIGIFIIGILSTGKQADMWEAIEEAAYRNDNRLCKSLLEMPVIEKDEKQNKRSGGEMITITPDAIKKLDKNTINLIELPKPEEVSVSETERFSEFVNQKYPEFKDKIIFMFGKFDITHFSKKDLLFLKNSIDNKEKQNGSKK